MVAYAALKNVIKRSRLYMNIRKGVQRILDILSTVFCFIAGSYVSYLNLPGLQKAIVFGRSDATELLFFLCIYFAIGAFLGYIISKSLVRFVWYVVEGFENEKEAISKDPFS